MSSEHSREVLREVAMGTADEGNVPGGPAMSGLLIAIVAIVAVLLIYLATTTAPSQRTHPEVPAVAPTAPR